MNSISVLGVFEEPFSDEEDIPGLDKQSNIRLQSYDLSQPEHLDSYWNHLEFVFTKKRSRSRLCFPANRAPEVILQKSGINTLYVKGLLINDLGTDSCNSEGHFAHVMY